MERETKFVDVIIPLALPRLLTYRVPFALNDFIKSGQRVLVQLRDKKLYTAIVNEVHMRVPKLYEAKYIDEILDEQPVVYQHQLDLWKWVAEYYCSSIGEVMNAALPPALKLASETKIFLNDDFDESAFEGDAKEWQLVEFLKNKKGIAIKELPKALGIKNVQSIIKSLVSKGIVSTEEELREKFKPKKTDFVKLGPMADSDAKLSAAFEELEKRKAQKQSDTLMLMLQLCKWDEGKQNEVERLILQKAAGVNSSVLQNMADKGLLEIFSKETGRLGLHLLASEKPLMLTDLQDKTLDSIEEIWKEKSVALLHGVTSSGKTEIYSELIKRQLALGKQVLYLLPEIALTTQIINRLRKYFGKRVGIYHSGYSDNERTEVWNKVLTDTPGECDIILGARSSIFLPYNRLGLIIVDEEHEHSFKQHEPAPRYNARDLAIILAGRFDAKVLLGSATPGIETYWNATQGKYGLATISERYSGIELPEIVISDLRQDLKSKTMKSHFGHLLFNEMQQALKNEEQIILFQNRRGYAPLWQCHTCGWTPQCTRCDVSLTYHKQSHLLKCHYCGYSTEPMSMCSACGSNDLRMLGFGTEKIEEDLASLFPDATTARMDLDTTRSKSSYQKIISDFESQRVQILVGTQMVTKGLDFDNVSLVGILHADKMMNFPDFRSFERSYQIMSQVAGRAGRKSKRGKVIIQTYAPGHWLLDLVVRSDYQSLFKREIQERRHYVYPPFARLIEITLKHKQDEVVREAAQAVERVLKKNFGERILGPEVPHVPRINNYYLRTFLIKLERSAELAQLKTSIIEQVKEILLRTEYKSVRLAIDVDPV